MSISKLVAISSSISETSKTARLLKYVTDRFETHEFQIKTIHLREMRPEAYFSYPIQDRSLLDVVDAIEQADGIIFATPIYKASFSGLLKSFLDVLPQFALAGKAVLPLATGGSLAHVLALDYSLRPVIQSMGARQIVQSYFLPEKEMTHAEDRTTLNAEVEKILLEAIHHFKASIQSSTEDKLLGHPRPDRTYAIHA